MSSLVEKFISRYGRLPTEVDKDYLEMLRMSKYRILAVPDVSPGKCANCGASKDDGRKYVDIGLHIDWYGALYLCTLCLKDIAQTAGLFNELASALSVAEETSIDRQCLKDQGEQLHVQLIQTFKEFEEFYVSLHSLGDDNSSDTTASVVSTEATPESGTNPTKSRTAKPTTVPRSQNFRSITDLLSDKI